MAETVHEFESDSTRGSFRGWLLNLTRWRIADKFRARKPHEKQSPSAPAPADRTGTIERLPAADDEGAVWEQKWQKSLLDAALDRLARRVPAKQFQIFDLYRRQDWSVLRVARELRVNPATVYVVSHRLTKQLKTEVARLTAQMVLTLGAGDFFSIEMESSHFSRNKSSRHKAHVRPGAVPGVCRDDQVGFTDHRLNLLRAGEARLAQAQ